MKMILNLFILLIVNSAFRWVFRPALSFKLNGVPVHIWMGTYAVWRLKLMGGHHYMAFVKTPIKWVAVNAPDGKANFAIIYHEVAHIIYPPAKGHVGAGIAHTGKGHRTEHQADRYAIDNTILHLPRADAIKEIRGMCAIIAKSSDGDYRVKLIKRYLRRYYSIEL